MNWILASGSPRRRELLEMLGVPDLTIRHMLHSWNGCSRSR